MDTGETLSGFKVNDKLNYIFNNGIDMEME